jgi:putative copper resistance protein D
LIWLLRDFDFLAVLLRAAALGLEALMVGGIAYLLLVAIPATSDADVLKGCRRGIRRAAAAMVLVQTLYTVVDALVLVGSSGMSAREVMTAAFFYAGATTILVSGIIWLAMHFASRWVAAAMAPLALILVGSAVSMSHSVSRLEHSVFLAAMTALHHLGTAAWIGAMPFLLVSLKRAKFELEQTRLARRFSNMALVSVATLVAGGLGMAWFFVGSWSGLYGTSYGLLLAAKVYLLLVMLALGAGNFLIVRAADRAPEKLLRRLRRFGEAEIGLGFTAILAAASLTSQPPAADMAQDRVTGQEIVARLHPAWPRLKSPPVAALTPPSSIENAVEAHAFGGEGVSDDLDRAWSEFNHHWAGLVVLLAGLLALASRLQVAGWARHWPLVFAGLAFFILLRADPENWPLGPRPFWASFSQPDVLQHRLYALLIAGFAVFEWGVQTGRWKSPRAAMVFPAVCALGGALLLLHAHAQSDVRDEVLTEIAHTPLALLGVTAGWARWLELRLPDRRDRTVASRVWPACLVLVGLILVNYRES